MNKLKTLVFIALGLLIIFPPISLYKEVRIIMKGKSGYSSSDRLVDVDYYVSQTISRFHYPIMYLGEHEKRQMRIDDKQATAVKASIDWPLMLSEVAVILAVYAIFRKRKAEPTQDTAGHPIRIPPYRPPS